MERKLKVGILGATGAVGQRFIELLQDHPWFQIGGIAASERSSGRSYADAVNWIGSSRVPEAVASMIVSDCTPDMDVDAVFSGLDSRVAGEIEKQFADAGFPVISNARNYRMQHDVPLLVPEINPEHLSLVSSQSWAAGGYIVTNPNCSTAGLACALKPVVDAFGVDAVNVTTMQALSGAGYPGVASLDAVANVIPFIGGEEEKLESEPQKILGRVEGNRVDPAAITISAQCNRVPVIDGHMLSISVRTQTTATPQDIAAAMAGFTSTIDNLGLPSRPARLIRVAADDVSPQPRKHVMEGDGMTITVGRIRRCPIMGVRFVALVHNTVRGAAGAAILNAELMVRKGLLVARDRVSA